MKSIFLILQLLILTTINAQHKCECDTRLLYTIATYDSTDFLYNDEIFFGECYARTDTQLNYKSEKGNEYVLNIKDCKGEAEITKLIDGKLSVKYYFANSLDTLKEYVIRINPEILREEIMVWKYFEALEHGVREYYDRTGKLYKTKKYKLGISYDY
jgi:hypothetical protein